MRYFPLFMDIQDEPVLVVGGGAVAERKVVLLRKAGARVQLVAKTLNPALLTAVDGSGVEWIAHEFRPAQLDGPRLVFAATDDAELNARVHAEAEARRLPVNVVDDREHCRFITPAIVDRDPVQVAISSAGASPVLARRIRGWIEALLPQGLGKVAAAAGRLRDRAAQLPLPERRRAWDRLLDRGQVHALGALPAKDIERRLKKGLDQAARKPLPGKVVLVGAGPGRADLLTLRALQALGQADVILHDRLVSPEILDLARRDADFIDVGKRCGGHATRQESIHELMVEHASQGRQVVRLKGGDPFVFGRGGEELEHLRAHGIDYEVVPGVTAAIGCAAFAGIPLTHRDHAHAVTLITGHTPEGGREPDWQALAGEGRTLAVYMGAQRAAELKDKLLESGLPADLPVALVADGTRDTQTTLHGHLDQLPDLAARAPRGAPALLVIGEVAAVGRQLAWFEDSGQVIDLPVASARAA